MSEFTSWSQFGQDAFAYKQVNSNNGTFLDIGASHPIHWNNTYGLELVGWKGVLMDTCWDVCDPGSMFVYRGQVWKHRSALSLFQTDALTYDYHRFKDKKFDYLSLDIDESSTNALRRILDAGLHFKVITVEHDACVHGDMYRLPQRELLESHGYLLAIPDVVNAEDWWLSK